MPSLPLPPSLKIAPSGFYALAYSLRGRSKTVSLRTADLEEAQRRAAAMVEHLERLYPDLAQMWQAANSSWSRWVQRQARFLAKSVPYAGAPIERIYRELETRLIAQGYRCQISGVPLVPLVPEWDPSDARLAVLFRKDPLKPWAPNEWRIVCQIVAAGLKFGEDEYLDAALKTVQHRRLLRR